MSVAQENIVWDKDAGKIQPKLPVQNQMQESSHETFQESLKSKIPSQFSGRRTLEAPKKHSESQVNFLKISNVRKK